jgi:primosomal protein N' (replication factor Y)
VRVALPVPLGQAFTYALPAGMSAPAGARVAVELGRRRCLGVSLGEVDALPEGLEPGRLKPLLAVVDSEPALPEELLRFLQELARYYLAPIGEVLRLALPALERATAEEVAELLGRRERAVGRLVQVVSHVPDSERPSAPETLPRGRAAELLQSLAAGERELAELSREFKSARAIVGRLVELGLVRVERRTRAADPFFDGPAERDTPPALNAGQRAATGALLAALDAREARAFLLDGVTASGKTEVYLHAAAHAVAGGRGVILLVPEIALTPQLVRRFRARLGDAIAVLHSGLSEPQRLAMWQSLRSGELRVVVGARSALFAPVRDLGLLCVDEEHDGSFKQEEGVRYSARDMALLRAQRAGAVAVLGSATPSLMSEALVMRGKLTRLVLRERARAVSVLPKVELIDLRRFGPGPSGDPLLSLPLHRALEEALAAGGQSILFLNRRGFAPSLLCAGCGTIFECDHCSVALTLHKNRGGRLECHYCDASRPVPSRCAACGGAELVEEGSGTERIEELLASAFPSARVGRLDRDVAAGAKGERVLERMRRGELDILVGTQMVTKGHDLPGVTLVGVLNADAALSLPDFRAAERTFHLLVQVAGRAGRADRPGRVLIQTRNPEHPAVRAAETHDVRAFVEHELAVREEVGYPPFARLGLVRLDGPDEQLVAREAARLARLAAAASGQVEVLGPAPAPLGRLRGRYRYQFMLRAAERPPLHQALLSVARAPSARGVRVGIDVDPLNML